METELACWDLASLPAEVLREAKVCGLTDARIASLVQATEAQIKNRSVESGIERTFKRVDTCAAEFPALTPYLYSTFGVEDESDVDERPKVMILGSGPNRIGQGIEFDYCCVHAAYGLAEAGFETIMVNCNPETVSTDYDTSDRLYFEPLTLEHVLAVFEKERPQGVVVQLGGQTPLKLARGLEEAGVPIWGTPPEAIDLAEDRKRFGALLEAEGIRQPENGTAMSVEEGIQVARKIGFPVLVRPSYVLGGRAMAICYDESTLERYVRDAAEVSPGQPILLDRFLDDAIELDLDLLADGESAVVAGILQHIEEAGIHSGDSAAVLPPQIVGNEDLDQMREIAKRLALRLGVVGLMNVQFAIHQGQIYVIEVNPRASRTVPFIAKAVGVPLVKLAAKVMAGQSLTDLGFTTEPAVPGVFVKAPVFPFRRFTGVDPVLGPEMKSTGEVMGSSPHFGNAFAKSWVAAGHKLPLEGTAFVSVHDTDKEALSACCQQARRGRLRADGDCRDRGLPDRQGPEGPSNQQSARRPAPRRRPSDQSGDRSGGQYAIGTRVPRGRRLDSSDGSQVRHSLHYHALGSHGSSGRDRRLEGPGPRRRFPAATAWKGLGAQGPRDSQWGRWSGRSRLAVIDWRSVRGCDPRRLSSLPLQEPPGIPPPERTSGAGDGRRGAGA